MLPSIDPTPVYMSTLVPVGRSIMERTHVTVTHVTVHVRGGVKNQFHSSRFYPSTHLYHSRLSLEYSLLCSFPVIYVGCCWGVVLLLFFIEILRNYLVYTYFHMMRAHHKFFAFNFMFNLLVYF